MGRATRWLKNLLGGNKDSNGVGDDRREKRRWSFKSGRGSDAQPPAATSGDNAAWLRSLYSDSDKEQSKHAIAVAAATAAAADAAVAAAQAAVAVVRLTSHGRGTMFGGVQERLAAVKIQTVFRGYLAKKALRALKALVKIQALVRGYLVRRQAAATLHSMQALVRAQATVRALRSRRRQPIEMFDETGGQHMASIHSMRLSGNLDDRSLKIVEVDTCRPRSRSSRGRTSPSLIDSSEDTAAPGGRNLHDYDWYSCTAQSTPRYAAPAKSVSAADGVFSRFPNMPGCPNYMVNTQSFEAKVRSQSAPKQRPEPAGPRKRIPLSELMVESRASLGGVGMQRSCARAQAATAFSFKSAVVDRLDRSLELGRDAELDFYLQRKW